MLRAQWLVMVSVVRKRWGTAHWCNARHALFKYSTSSFLWSTFLLFVLPNLVPRCHSVWEIWVQYYLLPSFSLTLKTVLIPFESSGRKNVLRIPYRRLKAGFSVCWLCLFVAGVLSEMHEVRTFAPCKAFLFDMFDFFFVAWKLLWIQNNQC